MKGILAYQAFNQISDTYVDESYIPGAEVLLVPPSRRTRAEREEGPLRRFMNSGWGVACISFFVALTVLAGIIYAGQNPPVVGPAGSLPSETETDNYSGESQDEVTVQHGDTVIYPRRFFLYEGPADGLGFEGEITMNANGQPVLPKVYYAKDGSISPCELNLARGYEFSFVRIYDTDMQQSAVTYDGPFNYKEFLSVLPVGRYYIALQIMHNSSCYEYAYELVVIESEGDTEIGTTRPPEETAPETTFDQDTTLGPETVRPDEPIDEPNVEAVLSQAEPMAPDIPEDAALVGETALTMWYSEDGSNIKKQVSRIAVYRDGEDAYTHYLYADVLANNGRIRQSETRTIHGCFALMESDTQLLLATVQGAAVDQNNSRVNILVERWYSWTDADAWSGEDLGDIRLMREESELGEWTASFEVLEKQIVRSAERGLVTTLSSLIRGDGGAENTGVLVDFFTATDTPRVYARADSKGEEAAEARGGILDGSCFSTAWVGFVEHMKEEAAVLDPAPPVPVETTNWEDYAEPMEPDVPENAVVMGYTYTTDLVTRNGETFEAISRIALYGFREKEAEFFLYRDVIDENGEIIASDTRLLPTLFGLAQSSLDGSLQLYTVTASRKNTGTAQLALTVQILSWSDVSPTGDAAGVVKAWAVPCEEASWTWEESSAIMANKGMDYGWQVYAFDIGDCWLQNTRTYWDQTFGEFGFEGSGYLTFLLDKLVSVKLEDMYVLHPEDDEETRLGTYFFLSTGSDHLNRWFQYYMSGLGFLP